MFVLFVALGREVDTVRKYYKLNYNNLKAKIQKYHRKLLIFFSYLSSLQMIDFKQQHLSSHFKVHFHLFLSHHAFLYF